MQDASFLSTFSLMQRDVHHLNGCTGKLLITCCALLQCAALVGEDQPLCPDLPELDLSELDVSDLDADSFLGGLKWYSDQSEIISSQYGNESSNLFEVRNALLC